MTTTRSLSHTSSLGLLLLGSLIASCSGPSIQGSPNQPEGGVSNQSEESLVDGGVESVRVEQRSIPGSDVAFELAYVPGGETSIGSPVEESAREEDEPTPTRVTIDDFWMARTELTFDEYAVFRFPERDSEVTEGDLPYDIDAVARPSPPYEDPSAGMSRPGYPATGMTQWAALQYARWLSNKTGEFYRLPTEAEWEHACRLGGDLPLDERAWYVENSGEVFHPVATKSADAAGLFDMLGNVSEWTLDQYQEDYAAALAEMPDNPWVQPTRLHPRTVRGGAFDDEAAGLRCGERLESTLSWKRRDPQIPKSFWWNTDSSFLGFRLIRPANQPTAEEQAAFWMQVLGD